MSGYPPPGVRERLLSWAREAKISGWIESGYPLALGGVSFLATVVLVAPETATILLGASLSEAVTAASIVAGFQGTSLAILLSLADRPLVMRLREGGYYTRLIYFHKVELLSAIAFVVAALVVKAMIGTSQALFLARCDWIFAILLGLGVYVVAATTRSGLLIFKILSKL